jgi:hypothetical protein
MNGCHINPSYAAIYVVDARSTDIYAPQTLPVLQPELELLPNENELPPPNFEANVEICLVMFWLWQEGQMTSEILLLLNTSSSNGLPQSAQTNSNIGILFS